MNVKTQTELTKWFEEHFGAGAFLKEWPEDDIIFTIQRGDGIVLCDIPITNGFASPFIKAEDNRLVIIYSPIS